MKKIIFYLGILSIGTILIIYGLSPKETQNGFVRRIENVSLTKDRNITLSSNQFSFANSPTGEILLFDYKNKNQLLRLNYYLNSIDTINIAYDKEFNSFSNVFAKEYLQKIFLTNNFGEVQLNDGGGSKLSKLHSISFDFFEPISQNTIIVRSQTKIKNHFQRELLKLNLEKQIRVDTKLTLPTQVDGFFCSDGWLHYDHYNHNIFYMYFYRGELTCLDTNLNIKYKIKTIDTITRSNVKVGIFPSKFQGKLSTMITQTVPGKIVNRFLTTDDEYLYLSSGLKADNESSSSFKNNQPIDVYSIKNRSYLFSFYIPKFNNHKLNRFQVFKNKIIAIFGENLVIFNIKKSNISFQSSKVTH